MQYLSKLALVCCLFLAQLCYGQTELKTMFYNLLNFSSAPPSNRLELLNSILDSYEPDLLMVCEVESQQDGIDILNESFSYSTAPIAQAPFLFNTSGASLIHQLVYYDTNKLILDYTDQIETNVRSINHYSFFINTQSKPKLEVFVAHFKASRGEINEEERLFEAQQFIQYIQNYPSDSNILLAGDFNMYSADEPGYQTLLNGTENLALVDPIQTSGDWNNNSDFAGTHTQSTRVSTEEFDDFGAGGGLDDRFDFMLISDALTTPTNSISYVDESYEAFGNNANCFNNRINSIDCDGYYDQELRDWLYQMSDHLPVVMKLSIQEEVLSTTDFESTKNVIFLKGNLVKNYLKLKFSPDLKSKNCKIYNLLGQELNSFVITDLKTEIDVSSYPAGLYLLSIEQVKNVEKFYVHH
ncbi:T9SS type A sorting domain-containing protein [Psychroflexus tropicus]|uniref:T9SS type A sorting domain-containing protein n=1 Tax=Psychroflexus tropicus TaxID=197345 RepID=UPI0003753666|nr:T9SS type A sorting domain-containing protein [Psychroflexus tropicus]